MTRSSNTVMKAQLLWHGAGRSCCHLESPFICLPPTNAPSNLICLISTTVSLSHSAITLLLDHNTLCFNIVCKELFVLAPPSGQVGVVQGTFTFTFLMWDFFFLGCCHKSCHYYLHFSNLLIPTTGKMADFWLLFWLVIAIANFSQVLTIWLILFVLFYVDVCSYLYIFRFYTLFSYSSAYVFVLD